MTPSEALKNIHTLVEASVALKDDAQRKGIVTRRCRGGAERPRCSTRWHGRMCTQCTHLPTAQHVALSRRAASRVSD